MIVACILPKTITDDALIVFEHVVCLETRNDTQHILAVAHGIVIHFELSAMF
jgi:hypothetical protein